MKKYLLAGLVVLAALAIVADTVVAQDEPGPGGPDRRRHRGGPGQDGRGRGPGNIADRLKGLDLTADQQAQVTQILDAHRQAMENWQKEHGDDREAIGKKLREAREAKDKEAFQAAMEEMKTLMGSQRELQEALRTSLGEVLTEEQLAKLRRASGDRRGPMNPFRALRMLRLSEEQQAQVKDILQAAEAEAKEAKDPKAKRAIMDAALKKIVDTVLDAEQAKKFEEIMKGGGGPGGPGGPRPELTEDQRAQLKGIMDEAKAAAEEAETREEKMKIFAEARKKIHETVLTEEQRTQFEQHRGGRGGHGGGPRGGPRGGHDRPRGDAPETN